MHSHPHRHEILARHRPNPRRRLLWGVALVALGTVFLLDRLALFDLAQYFNPQTRWWHFLPLLLALGGAITAVSAQSLRDVLQGFGEIVLGVWLFACLEQLWGLTFANSWPILLISLGLQMLIGGWFGTGRATCSGVTR